MPDRPPKPEENLRMKHYKMLGTLMEQDQRDFDGDYEHVNQTCLQWLLKEEKNLEEDQAHENEKLKDLA
jgi:hypothetical protein